MMNIYEFDKESLEYKKVSNKIFLFPIFMCFLAIFVVYGKIFTIEIYSPAQNKIIEERANFAEWTRYKAQQKTYDIQENKRNR